MKKANDGFIYCLILICVCLTACDINNPIIVKWWENAEEEDFDYVAIIKDVPVLVYDSIVEDHYIYQTIYEKIIVYVPEYKNEYVYVEVPGETVYKDVPVYIIVEMPAPGETIYIEVPVEVLVPGETIYIEVPVEVPVPGTDNKIFIKVPGSDIYTEIPVPENDGENKINVFIDGETKTIVVEKKDDKIYIDVPGKTVYLPGDSVFIEVPIEVPVPGETIYIEVPVPGPTEIEYVRVEVLVPEYIDRPVYIEKEVIVKVEVPGPTVIVEKPMPPEILMQHIEIINIEFIIFSGDQTKYNWRSASATGTNVTFQEQLSNNEIVNGLVEQLKENPEYFLILHGHANPVYFSQAELLELNQISTGRADSVRDAVALVYNNGVLSSPSTPPPSQTILPMTPNHDLSGRITTKGYGGGRNVAGPSSTYAGLNRRVEAILFTITTDSETKPVEPVDPTGKR